MSSSLAGVPALSAHPARAAALFWDALDQAGFLKEAVLSGAAVERRRRAMRAIIAFAPPPRDAREAAYRFPLRTTVGGPRYDSIAVLSANLPNFITTRKSR